MRVTTKGARTFFLSMLIVGAVLLIYQCFTMAQAFNLSPYTFKLRAKGVATDSVSIYGGSLHAEHVDSVIVLTLRAGDKVVTDTIQGAATVVGIVDDTLRLDTDSTGAYAIITFGGWGGGIRWNRSTDKMQYTNDFSTWTDIGTGGSSTTNADSLFHIPVFVRPQTDGYVLKFDADGDSLYLSEDATGAAGDSNAVIYSTNRVDRYIDSAQYFGNIGDSTFVVYEGVRTTTNSDDLIKFLTQIYLWEDVPDSIPVTWGSMMAQVGATGSGDITGVITSGEWLQGGASSGDVALSIRAEIEDAFGVNNDTTTVEGSSVIIRQPSGSKVIMDADSVLITNPNAGKIILNVDGTPTNTNEMTISENNIEIRSAGSNGVVYLSGYDVRRLAFGAAGTLLMSTGASSAPAFYALTTVIDTLTGTAIPLADSANGGAIRAETVDTSNQHIAVKADVGDSIAVHWAAWVADAPVSVWDSLHKYLDTNEALYSKIDTTTAKIPTATLADTTVGGAARAEVAKAVISGAITKAMLSDALVRQVVPLVNVHQPRYVRAGNDTLMLENAFADTPFVWMVVGGADNAKGTHLMTVTLPQGVTECDSIFFAYQSSSGTAATSAIDSIQVLVTSSGINPTWQLSETTARSSATQSSFSINMSADGDFNTGERAIIKFFTNVDANAWVGVIQCYLVCR